MKSKINPMPKIKYTVPTINREFRKKNDLFIWGFRIPLDRKTDIVPRSINTTAKRYFKMKKSIDMKELKPFKTPSKLKISNGATICVSKIGL
ncbi:MAG: hypothetical protein ACFFCL_08660 [Promethearchaeota archaeon]